MTPIWSPEPWSGNRHFSTSRPTSSLPSVLSAGLYRVPRPSWLYVGQSRGSPWAGADDGARLAPRTTAARVYRIEQRMGGSFDGRDELLQEIPEGRGRDGLGLAGPFAAIVAVNVIDDLGHAGDAERQQAVEEPVIDRGHEAQQLRRRLPGWDGGDDPVAGPERVSQDEEQDHTAGCTHGRAEPDPLGAA